MMQVRVFTAAVLVAIGLLGVPAAAAFAADPLYPPTAVTGGVPKTVVRAGGTVAFAGAGFRPGENVRVTMRRIGGSERDLGSVLANSIGEFELSAQATGAGRYVLMAVGDATGNVLRTEIVVRAASASDDGSLPVTGPGGSHWLTLLSVGVLAITAGTVLVRRSRRRSAG
jgi:LPXTG-motif cell wall-anchored protein